MEAAEAGSTTEKRAVTEAMRTIEAPVSMVGTEVLDAEAGEAIEGVITAEEEQTTLRAGEPLEVTRMEGHIISRLSGNDRPDKHHVGKRHYEESLGSRACGVSNGTIIKWIPFAPGTAKSRPRYLSPCLICSQ